MKKKLIFLLGAVTMTFVISTVGWFLLKPEDSQLTSVSNSKVMGNSDETRDITHVSKNASAPVRDPEARIAERTRQTLTNFYEETGQAENDYVQQLMHAMESPAYEDYMKQQRATPGFSFKLYFDFLESQGVESHRDMYENNFRQYYPTGSLASYEPLMRQRLAELFLDALPVDPKNSRAVTQQIRGVMTEFGKVPEQSSWVLAHFLGEGEWDWATDIQKNAAGIVAESTQIPSEPARFTDIEQDEDFSFFQIKEDVGIQSDPAGLSEVPPQLEAIEQPAANSEAPEAELITDIVADIPDLLTEADFQQTLRERFSPQRFNTAMQTLNQHGPEEGLRRLKVLDPEMATYVERLIQPNKETD